MNENHFVRLLALAVFIPLSLNIELSSGQSTELKAISFNIRYGTAEDGENHWDKRSKFLVETIKSLNPDLLGTQETLGFQRDYLSKELVDFDCLGVGRDDGKESGEMMALYYRRDRFEKLEGGHFWMSDTPEIAGSKSWNSSLPRMTTWVKLRDRKQKSASPILFMNTHFDHQSATARLESAKLLRAQADELGKDCLVVITGDFNADQNSPPYDALFSPVDDKESPLVDTYRVMHPKKKTGEGTYSGFKASNAEGARIDWIAASREWKIKNAEIDRSSRDGRTPSDHNPVVVTLAY